MSKAIPNRLSEKEAIFEIQATASSNTSWIGMFIEGILCEPCKVHASHAFPTGMAASMATEPCAWPSHGKITEPVLNRYLDDKFKLEKFDAFGRFALAEATISLSPSTTTISPRLD